MSRLIGERFTDASAARPQQSRPRRAQRARGALRAISGRAPSKRRYSALALARAPAWAITACLATAYVIASPPSTDLAAAAYRSSLFARAGFTVWDNSWYGGHHLPAYSILAPALGAWLGPQLLAALSMIAATALFALLIDGFFSARAARIAAVWFALGASVSLLANRVPFDCGLALGLGSLVAARYRKRAGAVALAVLCSLASPVAGAFLGLAFAAWALAEHRSLPRFAALKASALRPWPLALALAALLPIALLALVFPEGGTQPFAASAFYPSMAGVLLLTALIWRAHGARAQTQPAGRVWLSGAARSERSHTALGILLAGALLYAAALLCAYAIPTAVGGNAERLGALLAGPLAVCVLAGRRPRWLAFTLAPFLLYWQVNTPVSDFLSAARDPAVHASYYTPLLRELHALGVGYGARPSRVEVVPTNDHWEARFLAPHVALARGWERQLDQGRDAVFYQQGSPLSAARYRAWLSQQAVSYVALPDAPLDYSASAEAGLLRRVASTPRAAGVGAAGYLREIWRSEHWRLFAVLDPTPLINAPAKLTGLSEASFSVSVPHAGAYLARVRFTPYWALARGRGCVREARGGWTAVQAAHAGTLTVTIDFSLARIFDHGPRCR